MKGEGKDTKFADELDSIFYEQLLTLSLVPLAPVLLLLWLITYKELERDMVVLPSVTVEEVPLLLSLRGYKSISHSFVKINKLFR